MIENHKTKPNQTKKKSNEKCIGALSKYNILEANQK